MTKEDKRQSLRRTSNLYNIVAKVMATVTGLISITGCAWMYYKTGKLDPIVPLMGLVATFCGLEAVIATSEPYNKPKDLEKNLYSNNH